MSLSSSSRRGLDKHHVTEGPLDWDKSVIAWVIVAEGGNPAYPGFSAVEPKMVPWVFYFDMVLGCLTEPYILTSVLTIS